MNHVLEIVREEADGLWHAVCRACAYGTLGATEAEAMRNAEDAECRVDEEHQDTAGVEGAADPAEAHPGEEAAFPQSEE